MISAADASERVDKSSSGSSVATVQEVVRWQHDRLPRAVPEQMDGILVSFPWRAGASHAHVPYIQVQTALITELLDDSRGLMWLALREMRLLALHGMLCKRSVADNQPVFRVLLLRSFNVIKLPVGFSTSKMVNHSIRRAIAAMVMGIPWRSANMAYT
jgi:hypothetical protein